MPYAAREPTFLPLTVAAARIAADSQVAPPERSSAHVVQRRAEEANAAAAQCWSALLGGCESVGRLGLPARLRALSEATSVYVGGTWWLGDGSAHRRRVSAAEDRIGEAIFEGDGAEFAEAFVGYDQAVATAVVRVQSRLGSPTA